MKIYSLIVIGGLVLCNLSAHAQKKKEKDNFPTYQQIMPKFSDMVDHGLPVKAESFETPGGQGAALPDVKVHSGVNYIKRTTVVVPAESRDSTDKGQNKNVPTKTKHKKKLSE